MMIERIVSGAVGLVKKIIGYYVTRTVEAVKYLGRLLFCVGVNIVIMPSIAFITMLVMKHFGIYGPDNGEGLPFDTSDPIMVVGAMFLVGVFEEVYFRYFVMDCMLIRWLKSPVWLAVTLSSVVFGAAHLMNPGGWHVTLPQAVGAIGAGFWFAHVYRKYGLHMGILTHALYNSAVILISTLFQ